MMDRRPHTVKIGVG